jgi:hypothetical protein
MKYEYKKSYNFLLSIYALAACRKSCHDDDPNQSHKRTPSYMKRRNERKWAAMVVVGLLAGWFIGFCTSGIK